MMDRNYPSSSFADALAAPPQAAASWAYGRGSAAIKPSPSDVAPSLDGELLQHQSYTTTQQLPTYTTAHIPAAARTLESSSNNPVTSIMSFLSAMESRSLQAGPVSASLLPPFSPPSWTTGANSSTTELYLTGALPSTASFPSPAALSSFQHAGAYPSRSYAANTSLTLPDPAFSTATNGLFSHHDPLLHLKPSQAVLPTALAFNHLSTPSLGSALPVQSSTYRSAQESAPHLLQPQFGLLPAALPTPHGATQSYGATVFSGSVERALQRECSVIKHHQRPSSSHMASEHMPNSEDSLQGYFGSGGETDMSYQQDPARHTPVSCGASSRTDSTRGVSGSPQPESDCGTQPYSSTSLLEGKDLSSRMNSHTAGDEESHGQNLRTGSPEHYPPPTQKQNSVIANQQAVQLSSLMSDSLSRGYMAPQTQSQTSQSPTEKLSSLYTTLPSHSSHCDNVAAVSQALIYTSTPGLSQEQIQYGAQVQRFCQENHPESYASGHSHGAPNLTFTSQPQEQASATHSQSYAAGQSLNSVFQTTCMQSLPTSNSMVGYSHMQDSVGGKAHTPASHQQTQPHCVLSVPLSTYSSPAQPLQNNISSSLQETEPAYAKQKLEELPPQDVGALQQVSMVSVAANSLASHNNVIYVVSKMDDHKPQSVIRSNSRSEEQFLGLCHANSAQAKEERAGAMTQQQVCLSRTNGHEVGNSEASDTSVSSHGLISSEQLNQQLRSPEPHQQNQQTHSQSQSQLPAAHSQFMPASGSQGLLEPNRMILVQQPLVHQSQNASKLVSVQGVQPGQCLGPVHIQYLQMDRDLLCTNVTNENQSQQTVVVSEQSSECSSSSKHHYSQTARQQPNDGKNQFDLNSICFPDSMLLEDDRNILSNVDDILAATVAACGVAPQDFVKATSSAEAEMTAMASPVDSKGHLLTVDISQMSPSFTSPRYSAVTNTNCHTISMTLNGARMAADGQDQSARHNSTVNLAMNGDGRSSESGYHSARHVFDSPGVHNGVHEKTKCTESQERPGREDSPKKRARSKEGEGPTKPAKGSDQTKRQNSRGSDTSSPSASNSSQDSCPQHERIRQKIREVEEKQPEVRNGFLGSFLDFIKSGPKQQYSPSNARTSSRPRKPSSSCKPSTLHPLPPKVPALPGPVLPQESPGASSQQKHLEEDLQKNLETLPSFSSDEEESIGKNQALRNSISSALSALDETSDRKTGTENQIQVSVMKAVQFPGIPLTITQIYLPPVSTSAPVAPAPVAPAPVAHAPVAPAPVAPAPVAHAPVAPAPGAHAPVAPAPGAHAPVAPAPGAHAPGAHAPGAPAPGAHAPGAPAPGASAPTTVSGGKEFGTKEKLKETPSGQLAVQLMSVALEGLTDEEPSDSGGEGMYRERDEFVIRNEDTETFKVTMRAGVEPPAIWKVQKALLQKFVPELKDGKRVFSATNSYLGYFGDAKTLYKRVYVKFLETVNKREYVRVCSRKPRSKPMSSLKAIQMKALLGLTDPPSSVSQNQKSQPKQAKPRAEPPPKKRKKWKEEFSPTSSGSSAEEESNPRFASRLLNTRTTKETFKSFVELLISVALDENVMTALERANDELLLPHMEKVDGMITNIRKRLLNKLHMEQILKTALDSFPEISVVTELKKDGETPAFKVRLSGRAYNKKTMKPYKMANKVPQEYVVDQQKTQWFSLYHSLQHYKYHTYLMCKDEIASLRAQAGNLGQEEIVQKCLQNGAWVEGLFDRFGELISQVQQVCR